MKVVHVINSSHTKMLNITTLENVVPMLLALLHSSATGDKKLRCSCDDFLFLFFFPDE